MQNLFTEFRDIKGYEGKYKVSEYGDIYSVTNDVYLKHSHAGAKRQHANVWLGRTERRYVHRIVCETYNGPPEAGQVCRHLDGNPLNNHWSNLKWGSQKENIHDSIQQGTFARGESKVKSAKLTEADVLDIRKRYSQGNVTQKQLAEEYNVHSVQISRIVRGTRWAHLPI